MLLSVFCTCPWSRHFSLWLFGWYARDYFGQWMYHACLRLAHSNPSLLTLIHSLQTPPRVCLHLCGASTPATTNDPHALKKISNRPFTFHSCRLQVSNQTFGTRCFHPCLRSFSDSTKDSEAPSPSHKRTTILPKNQCSLRDDKNGSNQKKKNLCRHCLPRL